MEEFWKSADDQIESIHETLFEVSQLYKYAFKEDIMEEPQKSKESLTPISPYKKNFIQINKYVKGARTPKN